MGQVLTWACAAKVRCGPFIASMHNMVLVVCFVSTQ
jgi:hypothetical protein